jgi:hypothetical protein
MPSFLANVAKFGTVLASALLPMLGGNIANSDDSNAHVDVYDSQSAGAQGANTAGASAGDRWVRHAVCTEWITVEQTGVMFAGVWDGVIPNCVEGLWLPNDACVDGEAPLAPWWVSRALPDGTYGPWSQASGYQCATDLLLAQVERAWETMPIAPNTYEVEPSAGFAIAELGVNLVADDNPRMLNVTLMGTPVTIRAFATQYTWTNTDGTVWTSTTPGAPYGQGGKPFAFPRAPEHRTTFTLTTTWRGEFTTNGGATWRDAPGTATTTSASTTVHVYNPHTHLVDCDLNGNCVTGSQGAGNQKTILDPDGDGIDNYLIPDSQIADYLAARDAGHTWTRTERK